jgi:hypothetical protein
VRPGHSIADPGFGLKTRSAPNQGGTPQKAA